MGSPIQKTHMRIALLLCKFPRTRPRLTHSSRPLLRTFRSPATLPVANQWLSYDPESAYPDVLNFTLTTNASAAALFSVKYQPAYQSPKSGGWSCAWWQFIPPNGTATGFGSDISVAVLNYDPPRTLFPLLMTSWAGLHAHVSGWNVFAYGYTVLDNGTDTMVLHDGVKHNGSFVAYNDGNSSKTFVGFTESLDGQFYIETLISRCTYN